MCKASKLFVFSAVGFLIFSTGLAQAQDEQEKSLVSFSDLETWTCQNKADKEHWRVNEQGHLVTDVENVSIACELEFPEAVEIQLRITWENAIAFSFGLGVVKRKLDYERVPKIVSWEDALVLSGQNDFGIIAEKIDAESKEIELRIEWEPAVNLITVFEPGPNGRKILTQRFGAVDDRRVASGLTIVNRNGGLKVEKLLVRKREAK